MRTWAGILVVTGSILAQGQSQAPSQYFRKDFPAANQGQQQQPQAPQQPPQQQPQAPQQPPPQAAKPAVAQHKFKDVGTNAQFYFLTDTNRAYPWTKISASVATNMKNGARQMFHPELPVQP